MPSRFFVARDLADLMKALAHPDRIRLVGELRDGEKDVTALAAGLGVPAARMSQHLSLLRAHRLVEERRDGRRHLYRLTQPALADWIFAAIDFLDARVGREQRGHFEAARRLWAPATSDPNPNP